MNNSIFQKIRSNKTLNKTICFVMVYLQFYYPQLIHASNGNRNLAYVPRIIKYNNQQSAFDKLSAINSQQPEKSTKSTTENSQLVKSSQKLINNILPSNKSYKYPVSPSGGVLNDSQMATIGTDKDISVDYIQDNIFKISVDKEIKNNENLYLEYELYGLAQGFSTTKSINDEVALGGYLVQINHEWTKQIELIDKTLINKGINTIKFTAGNNYVYRIKNLKLVYSFQTGFR